MLREVGLTALSGREAFFSELLDETPHFVRHPKRRRFMVSVLSGACSLLRTSQSNPMFAIISATSRCPIVTYLRTWSDRLRCRSRIDRGYFFRAFLSSSTPNGPNYVDSIALKTVSEFFVGVHEHVTSNMLNHRVVIANAYVIY